MAVIAGQPFNAFIAGRQARQTEDYANSRNALSQMELQNAPGEMARRNALLDAQVQGAQQNVTQGAANFGREGQERELKQALAEAQHVAQNPTALSQMPPAMQQRAREQLMDRVNDPQAVSQWAGSMVAGIAARLGQGPAAPKAPESYTLSEGQTRFVDGKPVASVAARPSAPPPSQKRWVSMTPAEVQQAGLPEGTAAQRDPDSGQINILNKREGLSAAEQKQIRDAKVRMPRLNAAVRRVERVGNAVAALADNPMFDGGTVDAYILGQTPEGKELQAAVASLMPELQALTRVPGIGSQSDLEARLASLALPSLEMNPEINARTYEELKTFIEDLQAAYASITGEVVKKPPPPKVDGKARSLDDILNQYAK